MLSEQNSEPAHETSSICDLCFSNYVVSYFIYFSMIREFLYAMLAMVDKCISLPCSGSSLRQVIELSVMVFAFLPSDRAVPNFHRLVSDSVGRL